jgi:hypothetical protein
MQPFSGDAFEWIQAGRKTSLPREGPNWTGICVSHLMPTPFEAYVKILHSIEASYKNIDDPHPLTEREIAILKIPPCTKLRSFVESLRKEGRGPRIRWTSLAHLLGVPFGPEICHEWFRATMEEPGCWPRFLYGPGEGNLNDEESSQILSILRTFTGGQDCFFRFSEIAFITTDRPVLFCGGLSELPAFLSDGQYRITPEYWWPSDRSWCLCSDYDLDFTFVGGSKELISTVLKNGTLETLEVTSQTRVDSFAPLPR